MPTNRPTAPTPIVPSRLRLAQWFRPGRWTGTGHSETIGNVVAAFESEWSQSRTTLASLDLDSMIVADGEPVRAIRLVVDVLRESARHLGHIDILRELIDGVRGE
jgi:Protein of unknown function (DUF664)